MDEKQRKLSCLCLEENAAGVKDVQGLWRIGEVGAVYSGSGYTECNKKMTEHGEG